MTPELVQIEKGADTVLVPIPAAPPLDQVREFIRASKAENTLRGYQSDWRDFCVWCEARGLGPLPASAESVAAYIAECAGHLKVGSIASGLRRAKPVLGSDRSRRLSRNSAHVLKPP